MSLFLFKIWERRRESNEKEYIRQIDDKSFIRDVIISDYSNIRIGKFYMLLLFISARIAKRSRKVASKIMLKSLVQKMVESMLKYEVIPQTDKELYEFGVYQLIVSGLEILLMLTTGNLLGVGKESFLFLLVFMILRRYTGGYHASTLQRCVLMSWCLVCLACVWSKAGIVNIWIQIILFLITGIFIVRYAPIQDIHKKLYDYELKEYKKNSFMIWFIDVFVYGVLLRSGFYKYAQCIVIGVTMVLIVMCMSMFWNNIRK